MKAKLGKVAVSIVRGDITEAEVDAIVNAANAELWMGAGVAGAIKRKGGTVIEEDAVRQGPIEVGEAVITVAGNLNATHVIHAATRSALALAEKHRLSSVAFPALGTGVGGVPAPHCAEAMLSTLGEHLKSSTSSLERVVFVVYQDEALKAFTDTLKRMTTLR